MKGIISSEGRKVDKAKHLRVCKSLEREYSSEQTLTLLTKINKLVAYYK